jgi:hypothetical protein
MGMAHPTHGWTAEMVRALPDDGNRYEIVDGELLVTARHDRFTKRRLYRTRGPPEYWIVDLDAQLIERWKPDHERPE